MEVRRRDKVCQWPLPSGRGVCGGPIDTRSGGAVDHWEDRNDHRVESLKALCARHHRRKTAQEAQRGREQAAARRRKGR